MQRIDSAYCEILKEHAESNFDINGRRTQVKKQYVLFKAGEFQFGILALESADLTNMVGYAAFFAHQGKNDLIAVNPVFMELRNLHVDTQWRKCGIGSSLIADAKEFAGNRGKVLILKPERPGEIMSKESRRREYPMTTEQLFKMYIRHGFRAFTQEEQEYYIRELVDRDFTGRLWFDGLDPETLEFSEQLHLSRIMKGMGADERVLLAGIPLEKKEILCRRHSLEKYHHEIGIDQTWKFAREKLADYLVEDK